MLGDGVRCVTLPAGRDPLREDTTSVFVPEGDHGDATPLFLLPGFGLDGRSFGELRGLAAARRVVFWNPPNRLNGARDLTTLARLALDHATLAGCGERVILGGASAGGAIALHAALLEPERVVGLVLLGTLARWSDTALGVRTVAALHDVMPARWYHRMLPRILIPRRFDGAGGSRVNDALRLQMAHRTREFGSGVVGALRRGGGFDLRDRLGEIRQPALVIHGMRDHAVPPRAAHTLARLPASRVILLDTAGHVPFVSHARACVDALDPFLAEVDAGAAGAAP